MIKNLRFLSGLLLVAGLSVSSVFAQTAATTGLDLGPTLNKVNATGNFYIALRTSSVPFSYVLSGGRETPAGYSWEICEHIAKAVEAKVGKSITIVPVPVSSSGRIMMIKTGMADIECGSTTNTLGRQRQVAFSNTIFVSEVGVLVRAADGIRSFSDLNGKRVVTTSGTNAERLVRVVALQRGLSIKHQHGRENSESMAMLERGEADAFVTDDALLAGARAAAQNPESFALLPRATTAVEPYGLVLRNDDPVFQKLVNDTLGELYKSGEIEKIYDKWFNQPIPPNQRVLALPLSDLNKAAFANPNDKPAN